MSVEIVVPQSTVTVSPGVETRVRIQVSNTGGERVPVRIGVVRGRAAGWAQAEPAVVAAGPGESTNVDLVFRPPASTAPQSTLQPFTVQAEDLRNGFVAARATGLLAVSAPVLVEASLAVARVRRRSFTVTLTVENSGPAAETLHVRPTLETVGEKAPRKATAVPSLVSVDPGSSGSARIVGRPKRAFFSARRPYVLTVRCVPFSPDETDLAPRATATHTGVAKARLSRPAATVIGLLLVGSLTAGGVAVARMGVLPERFTSFSAGGVKSPSDPVSTPYALVDVFPIGSRPAADAARDRLNSAGMGVRVVDSRESGVIADGPEGFHVLIRDGFESPEAVQAYCRQYTVIAPNCQVVP